MSVTRRMILSGACGAVAAVNSSMPFKRVDAAERNEMTPVPQLALDREIHSILKQAATLGIQTPRTTPVEVTRSANRLSLYLGGLLDQALDKARTGDTAAADFTDRLGELISQLTRATRDLPGPQFDRLGRSAIGPSFDKIHAVYKSMFQSCAILPSHRAELETAATRILSTEYRRRYMEVQDDTKVGDRPGMPWYVIGALHYREANLNFMGHLHNGDFLKRKTTDVPEGRPPGKWPPEPWNAELAWRQSANDALQKYKGQPDWTLERMLYTFESFNGWGYYIRSPHKSPYIWNYTDKATLGGFPKDREWSETYVSKQSGLAAIIKTLKQKAAKDVVIEYYA
jgi:lysozyme family protein